MPDVQFQAISKSYGPLTVLEQLDLHIGAGEFVVLLGPSGCGKTTLLNILAGLMPASSGRIVIGGVDVTDLDPRDRGLAMVFQSYALYPTKTVRGNLKFGLQARRLSGAEIERRIAEVARLLQIEALLDRRPAQLSGGQRQRVAIGRALVKQVGVFLFDEPLSNLDAKLRTEMRMEIKKLHNALGNTIVYVTHDQVEAMTMATRIAVMNKGVVQQIGTPDEIYARPDNVFVADFIGAPGMNLLAGTLAVADGKAMATTRDGAITVDMAAYPWRAAPQEGAPVRIGFRPEHIVPASAVNGGKAAAFQPSVRHVEKTGHEALVFLALAGDLVAMRIAAQDAIHYPAAAQPSLAVAAEHVSLFDAGTGKRL